MAGYGFKNLALNFSFLSVFVEGWGIMGIGFRICHLFFLL